MSLLSSYLQKEQQATQLQEQLKKLESDPRFKKELEFKTKLEALMSDYDKSAAEVLALLNPTGQAKPSQGERKRRKRKLRVYENPNTGEVVETRGANQKTLKVWKAEYGEETVESWLVRVED